eukprot:5410075-Pyramimonas_sp.AAC.1
MSGNNLATCLLSIGRLSRASFTRTCTLAASCCWACRGSAWAWALHPPKPRPPEAAKRHPHRAAKGALG